MCALEYICMHTHTHAHMNTRTNAENIGVDMFIELFIHGYVRLKYSESTAAI